MCVSAPYPAIPENLDCEGIFDYLFDKYTKGAKLVKLKTINMDSLYELHYRIIRNIFLTTALSIPAKHKEIQAIQRKSAFSLSRRLFYHLRNPCNTVSSASFSVRPSVMSLVSCSDAILPMAASCMSCASELNAVISGTDET